MQDEITPEPPLTYATFWKRKSAYALDVIIVLVLVSLTAWLLGGVAHAQTTEEIQALVDAGLIPANVNPADLSSAFQQLGLGGGDSGSLVFSLFLSLAVSAIYNIFFVASSWQATPGKRWCNLMVVMKDGSAPSLTQSAYRHAASGISMLLLGAGYLTMAFNREKASLHDLICDTRVVVGKPTSLTQSS